MHGFESARGNLIDARDRNQTPQSVDCVIEMSNKERDDMMIDSFIEKKNDTKKKKRQYIEDIG